MKRCLSGIVLILIFALSGSTTRAGVQEQSLPGPGAPISPGSPPTAPEGSIPNPPITRVNPKDGAEMIFIPAGPFLMGSTDDQLAKAYAGGKDQNRFMVEGRWISDEEPLHRVTLDGYWIYQDDVTVAQYRRFCDATGRKMPAAAVYGPWKDNHPIVGVRWDDAKAYCDWAGVRLPTEAEWEKAARGTDGRVYPWGDQFDSSRMPVNDYGRDYGPPSTTPPVGAFPRGASPYGVLDMVGTVWQWCADFFSPDYYVNSPAANPKGPARPTMRVFRGGAWCFPPGDSRAAARMAVMPESDVGFLGFRCAASP